MDKYSLLCRGLFPETLPPCFTSSDLKRALRGFIPTIDSRSFNKRSSDYVRYSGTKHDGNRRFFGTPNPISYYYVAQFVAKRWASFDARFTSSPFSVSSPKLANEGDDRPIIIPSLSELTSEASKQIGHSPYILKTDISQYFPSIYTHSISWSAHGIDPSKADTSPQSKINFFNALDYFSRNCQLAETRGVLVGPDAFRLVSEFIGAGLDNDLNILIKEYITGAARHVDDYYIGLRSEADASIVLSALRGVLQRYGLHINDMKTQIMSGLEPLNEIWAQDLRQEARSLTTYGVDIDKIIYFINKAIVSASQNKSSSPIKIALRAIDQIRSYNKDHWEFVEPYLQRVAYHHPHCLDYISLLVVKRYAVGKNFDKSGWTIVCHELLNRHLSFNHHHEIVWMMWLMLCCEIDISPDLAGKLAKNDNAHIRALLIHAFLRGKIPGKRPVALGGRLASSDQNWLTNIVAKSEGYSKAAFSGGFSEEFEHLAAKHVRFIDLDEHVKSIEGKNARAISRTRYGYDSDDDEDEEDEDFIFGLGWEDVDEIDDIPL